MQGFVQGADRQQTTLFAECLDDWVGESNPVRAVDVFVEPPKLSASIKPILRISVIRGGSVAFVFVLG
jgi:hypothetical protein